MLLSEAIDKFLFATSLDARPATIDYYRDALAPLLTIDRPLDEVSLDALRELYAGLRNRDTRYVGHPTRPQMQGGLSVYSLAKFLRAWRRFFSWLMNEGIIKFNPAIKLRLPKLPHKIPKDVKPSDLIRLLNAARDNARDYAMICLLTDSGARIGGLASLLISDIDLDERCAHVREKGNHARTVYFKSRTENAIRAYLDKRTSKDGPYLFVGKKGKLTTGGMYQILKRLAKRAGVTGRFNPHAFRHAFAHQALKRGGNLKEVSELLGHSSIMVTADFYSTYLDSELKERHGQLSWLPDEE